MSNGDRSTSPSPARLHLWKISLLVVGAARGQGGKVNSNRNPIPFFPKT
ncbi:hypothetical protein PQG02_12940 [Nostoc sp. UHCC 0926]|nr:hypothetical protein [Nostoc sp. UHCC 0926]WDD35163.1 hypothetical protein PQG02_12940 [Nostoc sp. UHCC 0926]